MKGVDTVARIRREFFIRNRPIKEIVRELHVSRLTGPDWQRLRAGIDAKQVRIVALDLPTSWSLAAPADEFTGRMFAAVNAMMLDALAAVARKDYDDRCRRQAQGIEKAKAARVLKGRQESTRRNAGIAAMLRSGASYQQIIGAIGCSRPTIAKIRKRIDAEPAAGAG